MVSKTRDTTKYCEFQQDYGHDTNDCRELKIQIEEAVKSGKLDHLIKGIRKGKAKQTNTQLREWIAPTVKAEPPTEGKEEHILMIGMVNNPLKRKEPPKIMSTEEMIFPPIRNRAPSVDPILITQKRAKRRDERRIHNIVQIIRRISQPVGRNQSFDNSRRSSASQEIRDDPLNDALRNTITKNKRKNFATEHKLKEYKKITPVQQKKRRMAPKWAAAASKEVEELRKAGILKETRYQTWVANTVMVKKTDEAQRMCVDLTDINKACPKDCYSLPGIDWI
ncbi:hypothetical protein Tco_0945797 [Tanacetum coccineum]